MPIEFDANMPIYLQLIARIRQSVVSGEMPPGSKLPSVRDLAIEYGVNPNTVQRALSELERDGLLYTERTAGRYITPDTGQIGKLREALSAQHIERFIGQMRALGYQKTQLIRILTEKWSDLDGHD